MDFFPRSPDAEWNGSSFSVCLSYRKVGQLIENEVKEYGKANERGSRWTQIYARRPVREVYYLGIDKCVPIIESEKKNNFIYDTTILSDDLSRTILEKASYVLNKRYETLNDHQLPNGRRLIGVSLGNVRYSSLSMSAGEQKVFLILNTIFSAKKNALIIIEEIDLLLHEAALKKLIQVINERARDKNLQIIFTTHRESVINMSNILNVRHIVNIEERSYCFDETKPDAINRLTGDRVSPIEIYVEDDVAASIVSKICSSLKATKYIKIIRYGAAINVFTLLGAELLKNRNVENMIYVLDGDTFIDEAVKRERLNKVLTGTDDHAISLRSTAESKITQFNLPVGYTPEKYIHTMISSLNENDFDGDSSELIEAARSIQYEEEDHNYINGLFESLGINRETGLVRIIDLAVKAQEWTDFIAPVYEKIKPIVDSLNESIVNR